MDGPRETTYPDERAFGGILTAPPSVWADGDDDEGGLWLGRRRDAPPPGGGRREILRIDRDGREEEEDGMPGTRRSASAVSGERRGVWGDDDDHIVKTAVPYPT